MAQTYSEKLKDPRWQKKRLEILNRDSFQCRACGNGKRTLHVHHSHYRKGAEPWDYESAYLITLCEFCHPITEENRERLLKLTTLPHVQYAALHAAEAIVRWDGGSERDQHLTWGALDLVRDCRFLTQQAHSPAAIKDGIEAVLERARVLRDLISCYEEDAAQFAAKLQTNTAGETTI